MRAYQRSRLDSGNSRLGGICRANILTMTLRNKLGRVRQAMMAAAYRRPLALGDRGPIVSFTFDDFPRSAAQVAAPILESFGARGTYYVAPGLMNSSGEQGDLFVEGDLHFLMERGHEVASHTYDHSSCRSLSSLDFQKDVRRGIDAVHALTGGNPANFAYPFGHVTL